MGHYTKARKHMNEQTNEKGERESFLYAKVSKAQKWAYVTASRRREMKFLAWVLEALDQKAKGEGVDPASYNPAYNRPHEESEDQRYNR